MNPEWLRYYIAAKLNANVEDIDFNPDDFARAGEQRPGRQVREHRQPLRGLHPPQVRRQAASRRRERFAVRSEGERRSPRSTRTANSAKRCAKSWRSPTSPTSSSTRRSPGSCPSRPAPSARLHEVCSTALELFRVLTIYLKPVLPKLAAQRRALPQPARPALGRRARGLPDGHRINEYRHLLTRVEDKQLDALFEPARGKKRTP